MSTETTKVGGPSADAQSPTGGPEAGAERVTGDATNVAIGQPDQPGIPPKGNHSSTADVSSHQNVGLAKVFAGQPEAGAERVTGDATSGAIGQPDQPGIPPKGNSENTQSNDNLALPTWAVQLPKKLAERLATDPKSAARLSTFKNIDDLVIAYLDSANTEVAAIPGKDSTPEEVQTFYERLGKPKTADGYSFAKNAPDIAREAFNANLSMEQADALFKSSLSRLDDARKGLMAIQTKDFKATDDLLRKEYGDRYEEALILMNRGMGTQPKSGNLSPIAQALFNAGLAGKPEIVRAFIELGRATSEGTAPAGSMGAPRADSILQGRGFDYQDNY